MPCMRRDNNQKGDRRTRDVFLSPLSESIGGVIIRRQALFLHR